MATKGRELTNPNPMTEEENGSIKSIDFLERGAGERRRGSKRGKSGDKGMGKEKKHPTSVHGGV